MGRKRRVVAEAKSEETEDPQIAKDDSHGASSMTDYERQRAAIIARNRERMMALGIPSLVKQLQQAAEVVRPPPKKPRDEYKPRIKHEPGAPERPTRRSTRLQEAAEHPQPKQETAEERFERELGQFVVDGECPRCGREMERGQRAHLAACSGAAPRPRGEGQPRREAALEGLTEEEKKSAKKRLLARMKQVNLDGLVDFSPEEAKFVVLGSKGDPYTIVLKDDKHTCTCMDYRFRRHNCKHICAALDHLGIMDRPTEWKQAVEAQLDKLVQETKERHAKEAAALPRNAAAEMAERFL